MLFALGAVSTALDALQSLTSSKSSATQQAGFTQGATNPFSIDSGTSSAATSWVNSGNGPQISPQTMGALIAAQSQSSTSTTVSPSMSPQNALKDLFSKIDADGDGKITKSEFEQALGAGGTNLAQADDVFSKLDSNGDGSVSLDEMSKALGGAGHHRGHHAESASGSANAGGNGSGSDPLSQALDGASSTSVTNSDGSTTTTITYADGSKVSMTTPVASSSSSGSNAGNSNSATSSYNWIEQMIQREAQQLQATAASSLSVSV